jgi:hypothetical protein
MGLRVAVIVCTTSFLLGILATHWIADSLTLWQSPLTESHLRTSAAYYSLLAAMPSNMMSAIYAVGVLAGIALFTSLWDGRAGNLMFDSASIFLYCCSAGAYLLNVLPNLQHLETHPPNTTSTFPPSLQKPTVELASAHLVCSVALTGVLLLQGGRWFAEEDELAEDAASRTSEESEVDRAGARGRRRMKSQEPEEREHSHSKTSVRRSTQRRKKLNGSLRR